MASSSVEDEIKGLCRICAGSIGPSGGGVPKIDLADPILNCLKIDIRQDTVSLTRRLSGFDILNNAISIFQKWLVSRHFANIFHYLNFSEEYL